MKNKTKQAIEQLFNNHDFMDLPTRGGDGTQITTRYECRYCGLSVSCFNDRQNGIEDQWSFDSFKDGPLSLKEAIAIDCMNK